MKHLRLWILGAAVGSFAAGMNVGLVVPTVLAGGAAAAVGPDSDQAYVRDLALDYGLSSAQQRSLRLVMQRWREEEVATLRSLEAAALPAAIQKQLLAARGRMEQRVRALLDDGQRVRYDNDSRPRQNR